MTGRDVEAAPGWESTRVGAHLRGRATSGTAPEVALRRALHAMGLRYRLGRRVGRFRPDLVFPASRTAVFVDGCFWHGCPDHGAAEFQGPNAERWREKLRANRDRDVRAVEELGAAGWCVVRVWECRVRTDPGGTAVRVAERVQRAAVAKDPGPTSD